MFVKNAASAAFDEKRHYKPKKEKVLGSECDYLGNKQHLPEHFHNGLTLMERADPNGAGTLPTPALVVPKLLSGADRDGFRELEGEGP